MISFSCQASLVSVMTGDVPAQRGAPLPLCPRMIHALQQMPCHDNWIRKLEMMAWFKGTGIFPSSSVGFRFGLVLEAWHSPLQGLLSKRSQSTWLSDGIVNLLFLKANPSCSQSELELVTGILIPSPQVGRGRDYFTPQDLV